MFPPAIRAVGEYVVVLDGQDDRLPGLGGYVFLYYRAVVFRAPPKTMLHYKGCCGLVFASYHKMVQEGRQLQPLTLCFLPAFLALISPQTHRYICTGADLSFIQ